MYEGRQLRRYLGIYIRSRAWSVHQLVEQFPIQSLELPEIRNSNDNYLQRTREVDGMRWISDQNAEGLTSFQPGNISTNFSTLHDQIAINSCNLFHNFLFLSTIFSAHSISPQLSFRSSFSLTQPFLYIL